ncbi:GH3 auxin-responsive promoter [Melanogaster broomeanus]|nr:GH3 auxin-responsive promoter [Melanogaster broomeanus]
MEPSFAEDFPYSLYRSTVPTMTYEEYRPFIARFQEFVEPDVVPISKVNNLFAPGLPAFVAHSSGTSGGLPKWFAKYGLHPNGKRTCCAVMENVGPKISDGTICAIGSYLSKKVLMLTDPNGETVTRIPVCPVSTGTARVHSGREVSRDRSLRLLKGPNLTSPFAVLFIQNFKTFMIMNILFALADRQLACISCVFATVFRDFYRIMEENWDLLIHSIEIGVIPDLEGLDDLKEHLQVCLPPSNPRRADELRAVGRDTATDGWMKRLWPNLRRIVATTSGAYATIVPEVCPCVIHLGSDIEIHGMGITATESYYALPYHSLDAERYRLSEGDDFVEFLPLGEDREPSLLRPPWEVVAGESYEIFLTTHDGLWRYAVGDIVTVVGFDPKDGQPVIRFTGRTSGDFRLQHTVIPEKEVIDAIRAAQTYTGAIAEFTATADFRKLDVCHGFFIELHNELGPEACLAPEIVKAHLCSANFNYAKDIEGGRVGPPTVRVVRKGTFMEYREWKITQMGTGLVQTKVPIVTWDKEMVAWLEERVDTEL